MKRSEQYNTKQKDLILETIKNYKKPFTIKDIFELVSENTGLTTVYRLVDKLVEKGLLDKYIGNDNTTYYQYLEECNCSNHFYLKCECCTKLTHIDCDCIEELTTHITKNHKFKINTEHIIINGICKECLKK